MKEDNSERAADKLRMLGSLFCSLVLPKMSRDELLQTYVVLHEIAEFDPKLVTADEMADRTGVPSYRNQAIPQDLVLGTDEEAGRMVIEAFAKTLTSITDDYRAVVALFEAALSKEREKRAQDRMCAPPRVYTSDAIRIQDVFPTVSDRTT